MRFSDYRRADLERLLTELGEALLEQSEPTSIRLVGGAAIVLAHDPEDRGLTDVDALYSNHRSAVAEAAELLRQRDPDLGEEWLNFKANMYSPDGAYPEPEWVLHSETPHLRVYIAPDEMLLAMKLHAARRSRDFRDLETLLGHLDVKSKADALAILERFYPADIVKAPAEAFLDDRFGI